MASAQTKTFHTVHHDIINFSTAQHKFSFSKDNRFKQKKNVTEYK